jgi:predicted 2-oxoglutarate/Fe(II)-dependent dioxygenase YbiX
MTSTRLFGRLGLFVVEHFLDGESCDKIRQQLSGADSEFAGVFSKGADPAIDTNIRRVHQTRLPRPLREQLKTQLLSLKPTLDAHFHTHLEGVEDPALLRYLTGDFYHPHTDGSSDMAAPEFLRRRRVSLIVFLNSEAERPGNDSYCGGAVTFYGLVKKAGWEKYGFQLNGRAGLLVGFESDVVHEVKAVTSGERFTMVSWFYE